MDESFKKQEEEGIIERIPNLEDYLKNNPGYSFLPHMRVFKLDRLTTKCRIVFLSNLCERNKKNQKAISHNQAIYAGLPMNQSISTSLIHLRFGKFLLAYDLKGAFNQIKLSEEDSNKLLFLWFRNPSKGDFSVVGYRNKRLSFGIRCAPTLLMLAMYKILVIDAQINEEQLKSLKLLMYQLLYMDNGGVTAGTQSELVSAYSKLEGVFKSYGFQIQQIITNNLDLQISIDNNIDPVNYTPQVVKLLGTNWDRSSDHLFSNQINLNIEADTKRSILQSIASQYDVHNYNGPILNRSRLFLHKLQCDRSLNWDKTLSKDSLNEWKNIVRQANSAPPIKITRFIGERDEEYRLIACTDASKDIYGIVVYIQALNKEESSFVLAKNRMVNSKLQGKSIPSLELLAVALGAKTLQELHFDLAGPACVSPIKISEMYLYTDSMVTLHWLNSYTNTLDKMNKRSIFVMNRLSEIERLCEKFPITFKFISGMENPSDYITRCVSHKQLIKTNYIRGVDFAEAPLGSSFNDIDSVTIPRPDSISSASMGTINFAGATEPELVTDHLIPLSRFEHFKSLIKTHTFVLKFINALKLKLKHKYPNRYKHFDTECSDLQTSAKLNIIRTEQKSKFPEIFSYFASKSNKLKDIPNLVSQLNIFPDKNGILRVKSKMDRPDREGAYKSFPVLLPKKSLLTSLIVSHFHVTFFHVGVYHLISELKKQFWIPCCFSVVKGILKTCTVCNRLNNRPYKISQSSYRETRIDPPNIPFSYIYVDYLGPLTVKSETGKSKVWILCITSVWSRAVNLKVCYRFNSIRVFACLTIALFPIWLT